MLGELNSSVFAYLSKAINPTLNMNPGDTGKIPFPSSPGVNATCSPVVKNIIDIAKLDWDSFEISWHFSRLPWLPANGSAVLIQDSWASWSEETKLRIQECARLERENNLVYIKAYGLEAELNPDVPDAAITLARADREKDCQRLISFAIGCTMGRFSIDAPGLIYANAGNIGFDPSVCGKTFPPDADGIVPITEEHWFEDDAGNRVREFLRAAWGPTRLEQNVAWLAESLGMKGGEMPDDSVRRYLADKFFRDHVQTYRKRPIYWLFSSGKQGAFQALVYLHRYHEGTLARMRAEYVVPMISKMESRLEMLDKDVAAATSAAARTKLQKQIESMKKKRIELLAFDEKLRHYADMRITLNLDNGVKVNYARFGDLVAESKAITGGSDE